MFCLYLETLISHLGTFSFIGLTSELLDLMHANNNCNNEIEMLFVTDLSRLSQTISSAIYLSSLDFSTKSQKAKCVDMVSLEMKGMVSIILFT